MSAPIRVLIADDSRTVREALADILGRDSGLLVVGQANDGREAVSLAKTLHPDVITMDVQMPVLNGLEATNYIMRDSPTRILVVASVSSADAVELSFKAIAVGALEVIAKPDVGDARIFSEWGVRLCHSVRLMAEVPVVRRHGKPLAPLPPPDPPVDRVEIDIVGIAASTGGPPALARVLGALPAGLSVPILICQHMGPGFGAGLVRWLSAETRLTVVVAGAAPRVPLAGHVYSAPDGHDLEVDHEGKVCIRLGTSAHCPSGNRLFRSLARFYGPRAAGFVLTGMGDDGTEGLRAMRDAGGMTYAQEENGCVVYGMPRVAITTGAAIRALSLEAVAATIRELGGRARRRGP